MNAVRKFHGMSRKNLVMRSYRIPRTLDAALHRYSTKHKCSVSDLIRESVSRYIGVELDCPARRRRRSP